MKALAGQKNWLQKLGDGIKKFAHGVALGMTPGAIPAQINAEANLAIQQRREELQVKEMELAVLKHEDNKAFQEHVAQGNYERNIGLQQSNQAANEKLARENYQRNLEMQWNNQAFQEKLAQLSHENQQKLEKHRAMVQLAIHGENLDFQKWRLEQEKALQLQIISIRQEFEREIARYNRETALNNIREQRRQANFPIDLVSDDLLKSPYRDGTMPLQILLSPPELNYDSFGQKSFGFKIENHLAEELRQFLDTYYSFNGENRQTQLLDGAWVSKKFRGGGGIKSLFSQLKTVPIVVLESEVDSDYLNFRVAYWRGDDSEYQYRSILSNFPYRNFLYESARERARKWQVIRQLLLNQGRTSENVKAIGGDNDFNLFILQEEQQLLNEGFDLNDSDIEKQYRVNEKDFKKLHQFLITCHCLTVSVIADIHYLSSGKNLTPLLPSLLHELLEDVPDSSELQTTMLDWLLTIYNQMYEKLEEIIHSWIPELILQFAVVLTSLEDKSYAIQQGRQSVQAWLRLHGMETIDRKSLHSIVTKDDEPYFEYLQEFLIKVGDLNDLSEAKILLEAWLVLQDLGIVKDKSTVNADDYFQSNSNNADDIFDEAIEFSRTEQYDKAIACYDEYLKLKPGNSGAWFNRGVILRSLNKHEEAIASYDQAFHHDSNLCLALIYKAQSLESLNKSEEAIASYDKALQIRVNDATTWMFRGDLLRSLERYEEAIFSYDNAIKFEVIESEWTINKDWEAAVWLNRGNTFKILKNYEEAITSYDRVIHILPNNSVAWSMRGDAYMRSSFVDDTHLDIHRWQNAINDYSQAIFLNHDDAESCFNLGMCYQMIKEKEKAIESYQKAAKIYHTQGEVEDYCKAIKMLNKLLEEKTV